MKRINKQIVLLCAFVLVALSLSAQKEDAAMKVYASTTKDGVTTKVSLFEKFKLLCSNSDFEVVSYTIVIPIKKDFYKKAVKGNTITDEIKFKIRPVKVEDIKDKTIWFEDIVVKNKAGETKTVKSFGLVLQ